MGLPVMGSIKVLMDLDQQPVKTLSRHTRKGGLQRNLETGLVIYRIQDLEQQAFFHRNRRELQILKQSLLYSLAWLNQLTSRYLSGFEVTKDGRIDSQPTNIYENGFYISIQFKLAANRMQKLSFVFKGVLMK